MASGSVKKEPLAINHTRKHSNLTSALRALICSPLNSNIKEQPFRLKHLQYTKSDIGRCTSGELNGRSVLDTCGLLRDKGWHKLGCMSSLCSAPSMKRICLHSNAKILFPSPFPPPPLPFAAQVLAVEPAESRARSSWVWALCSALEAVKG